MSLIFFWNDDLLPWLPFLFILRDLWIHWLLLLFNLDWIHFLLRPFGWLLNWSNFLGLFYLYLCLIRLLLIFNYGTILMGRVRNLWWTYGSEKTSESPWSKHLHEFVFNFLLILFTGIFSYNNISLATHKIPSSWNGIPISPNEIQVPIKIIHISIDQINISWIKYKFTRDVITKSRNLVIFTVNLIFLAVMNHVVLPEHLIRVNDCRLDTKQKQRKSRCC